MKSGYIEAFLYALFTAISFNFIDHLGGSINQCLTLLVISVIAAMFFSIINYKSLKSVYILCWQDRALYAWMTLCIGVNWLCSIFAPHIADPFIYLALNFIVMSAPGLIFMRKNTLMEALIHYACAAFFILIIVLTYFLYDINAGRNLEKGFCLGLVGGISGYWYAYFSNKLVTKHNFSPSEVLAVRFTPLIAVLVFWVTFSGIGTEVIIHEIDTFFLMAILCLIVPIYFLQSSIKKLGVTKSSLTISITPGITFILYSIFEDDFDKSNFLLAFMITAVLILSKLFLNSRFVKNLGK